MTVSQSPFPLPIADFVPHGSPMLLIDRILSASMEEMSTEVTITADSLFFVPGQGIPAYAGVEYIAQSVSAFNCWRERRESPDAPPRVGFLLGSRQVTLPEPWFPEGAVLTITVREIFQDGQMGVYEGTLTRPGVPPLTTNINVYLPDPDAVGFPAQDTPEKEPP
ncbi:MAG: hypothetical protein K9H25_18290 [Rhodospirillum sp.]|nr:hypothetical protein [Rhodospirillum sp.]MCF8490848.1 hypothetical protein [Rhodospirillum sp.]MCF8501917.1 hypothetical protein [Rhodospirillum sp.]